MYDLIFTDTGVTAPSAAEIKEDVQNLFISAFGTDLTLEDATPQGQLITDITSIIAKKNAEMLYIINQFNPGNSSKPWQDAIGQLYFLERKAAVPSTVQCVCRGLSGTVIPGLDSASPAQAQGADGEIFSNISTAVIPESGEVTLTFQANNAGSVPVAANTVNKIYTQIIGWDSINNPTGGIMGSPEENRVEYEERRRNSLALYATGSREAVYSKVYNVENVSDVVVVENDSSEAATIQGVTLIRNSIYVVVNGGDNTEIATAIYKGKSGGCATNGEVSVLLPGTEIPIKFDRPSPVNIFISVTLDLTGSEPSYLTALVQNAVLNNFTGADGSERVKIGETIYASRFYPPLVKQGLSVVSIKIAQKSASNYGDFVTFNLNEQPVLDIQNIEVEVNA